MKKIFYLFSIVFLCIHYRTLAVITPDLETTKEQAENQLANQPVQFVENKGQLRDMNHQAIPYVLYKVSVPGVDVYITKTGLTYVLSKKDETNNRTTASETIPQIFQTAEKSKEQQKNEKVEWNRIEMKLQGASIKEENITTEGASTEFFQYFLGHCPDGIKDVHSFQKIIIKNIYPNIDWVLYNSGKKGVKYDFILHRGADYNQIELLYSSLKAMKLDERGNLRMETAIGTLTENKPVSFLNFKQIESTFSKTLQQQNKQGGYDTYIKFLIPSLQNNIITSDIVIDPQLTWATYFGGESCSLTFKSITSDKSGNVFCVGAVDNNLDYPTLDAGTFFQGTSIYNLPACIVKFNNKGVLLWSTLYGGDRNPDGGGGETIAFSVTTDMNNNVFIGGTTATFNFPTQDAGGFFQGTHAGSYDYYDAFILKFDNAGNRLWATYYGGTDDDALNGCTLSSDSNGNLFMGGQTRSYDFPTQSAGTFFQGTNAGYFDAFILKFDNAGNRLWATYYGGYSDDRITSSAIDTSGNIFFTGYTKSPNFPTKDSLGFFQGAGGGDYDAFILKFDNSGDRLWATYYGGGGYDFGSSVITDNFGNVFVSGSTGSDNFPTQNAGTFFQGTYAGGNFDAFILKFNNIGNRLWASYYGGSGFDYDYSQNGLAIDGCGNIYMGFQTRSIDDIRRIPSCDGGYNDSTCEPTFVNYDFYIDPYYKTVDDLIAQFSNNGELLWATLLGGKGPEAPPVMAVDKYNNLFITQSPMQFNSLVSTTYPHVNPGGGAYYYTSDGYYYGSFIMKFTGPSVSESVQSACSPCDNIASVSLPGICQHYSYLWSDGQTTPVASSLCEGNYTLTITDTVLCHTQTDTVIVKALAPSIADFISTPGDHAFTNSPVVFTDQSTNGTELNWDFGDPSSGTDNNSEAASPSHSYSQEGNYCIQLYVSSAEGCKDTVSKCIIIDDDALQFPNVFTPNGDNQNDVFYIRNLRLGTANLTIYNRWGNIVYHTTGYNNNWNGQGVTDGTYYYTFNYPADEKVHTGFVQILRN